MTKKHMSNGEKNNKVKKTIRSTRQRHSNMDCRVFEIKVVGSKLNAKQKEQVNQYFREAKWRRNNIIADFDKADRNAKVAVVKVGDTYESRELSILGSQVRQDIYEMVKAEIRGLHTKKKQGNKVGKLQFKSVCNSIPLRQYNTTYRIDFEHNRIKVQNIHKPFYVRGLKQIPQNSEITNAKFIRKPSGLYFHITCFIPKETKTKTNKQVGIDFGIEHNLTLSDGTVFDICIEESKGTKLASKRLNQSLKRNKDKKSNNHYKRKLQLKRAYEKDKNKRNDKSNKIVHYLLKNYDFIAIQDEMIHNWHSGLFGKQVQYSAMGSIKAKLKTNFKVYVVERRFPSTQVCPSCGSLTKHSLDKRIYKCEHCNYKHPSRDIKSAQSILDEALKYVSMEHRANSLVELTTSGRDSLSISTKYQAMKQEAQVL